MPVFCCFPGTGKSYFAQQDHRVIDLESSDFKFGGNHSHRDYDTTRSKQATWPYNYVERIQELAPSNIVFASTHIEVRQLLSDNGVGFFTVYPSPQAKSVYLNRYAQRGSDPRFLDFMRDNFDTLIADIQDIPIPRQHLVQIDIETYISDLMADLNLALNPAKAKTCKAQN